AMQSRMLEGVMNASDASKPDEARVEPFVIPLLLPNGRPAAIVDCYVNTNMRTFSLVHTELSIPPRSKDAIDYLRDQHLCRRGILCGGQAQSLRDCVSIPIVQRRAAVASCF